MVSPLYYKFEERRRPNELNSKAELDALPEIIKQVNYLDSNPVYRDIHNYDKKMIGIIIENIKDIESLMGIIERRRDFLLFSSNRSQDNRYTID